MLETIIRPEAKVLKLAFMASMPCLVSVSSERYVVTSFSTFTQFMEKMQKTMAKEYKRKNR